MSHYAVVYEPTEGRHMCKQDPRSSFLRRRESTPGDAMDAAFASMTTVGTISLFATEVTPFG